MVKKLICGLTLLSLLIPIPVLANNQVGSGIRITPAIITYDSTPGQPQKFTLQLENYEPTNLSITLSGTRLRRSQAGTLSQDSQGADFQFTSTELSAASGQTVTITGSVTLSEEILRDNYTPAIVVAVNKTGSELIAVKQTVLIPILPAFTAKTKLDLTLAVLTVPQEIVTEQQFTVNGSVENTQNRYVAPAARIELMQGSKFINSWSLTDLLPEQLERGLPVAWSYRVAGADLTPFTNYQLYLYVTDTITKQTVATGYSFYYFPAAVVIILIALIILIIIGLSLVVWHKRHNQRSSQRRPH